MSTSYEVKTTLQKTTKNCLFHCDFRDKFIIPFTIRTTTEKLRFIESESEIHRRRIHQFMGTGVFENCIDNRVRWRCRYSLKQYPRNSSSSVHALYGSF